MKNFHARQYDPQIGRFNSVDPMNQFFSGFVGMGNDPANMIDPSGMKTGTGYQTDHNISSPVGPIIARGNEGWTTGYSGMNLDHWEDYLSLSDEWKIRDNVGKGIPTLVNIIKPYSGLKPYMMIGYNGGIYTKNGEKGIFVNTSWSDLKFNGVVNKNGALHAVESGAYNFIETFISLGEIDLEGAQSNGGDNSTSTFWNNVNTGIGAFDVGQGAKGELISYAAKSSPEINNLKYVKGIKVLGYATFGVSSAISVGLAGNYYANGGTNSSVGIKASLDIIMGGVGFLGPIGFGVSATYFLLDAGGAFGGYGDPLLTPKR